MGCPAAPSYEVTTPYQEFENGFMILDSTEDRIYAFDNAFGGWLSFPDEWEEGDPEFACDEAEEEDGPRRGFSVLWCDSLLVRTSLGEPEEGEVLNTLTFQRTEDALLINIPQRPATLALFRNGSYVAG